MAGFFCSFPIMRRFSWILLSIFLLGWKSTPKQDFNHWEGHYTLKFRSEKRAMDLELKIKANGKSEMHRLNYHDSYFKDRWSGRAKLNEEGNISIIMDSLNILIDSNLRCLEPPFLKGHSWDDVDALKHPFNSSWNLSIMANYHYPEYGGAPLTLGFNGDSIYGGYSGCNSFGGAADLDSLGLFSLRNMNSTLLYCEPMDLEERYSSALFKVRSYKIPEPRRLVLYDSLGNALLFYQRQLVLN